MAPLPHKRSYSTTDVYELQKLCYQDFLPTPFDISAAVGYDCNTNIFKICRPKGRKMVKTAKRKWSLPVIGKVSQGTERKTEDEKAASICAQSPSNPPASRRPRNGSHPLRSKSEGKCCDLRDTRSLMLLPHLTLDLRPEKQSKAKPMKSDVVVKFPEKSVLLLAQDDEDQTQIELSLSSVTSESDSLQNLRRRRRDSGVFVSDEAVLTWRRREEQSKSEPIITSASGSFSNQHAHIRRVATKSSLQSTYIPILDKLTEEPLSLPKEIPGVSKEGNGIHVMVDLRSICGPTERRDIGDEIVLGHWQRPEQKRGSEKETDSGSSFQNATQTSSIQKRRATIATETPAKELSPHYATKLEKQAFNKIKEWKEGFAIQLDQVLQQRQNLSQQLQNQGNRYVVDYYSPVYCGDDVKGQTTPSPLSTRKSMSSKQAFAQNLQHRLITELRGLSQMSVIDNKGIPDADRGSKILQEIKKQREKFRDVDENKKLKDELRSLQIQNTQRIAHDMHLDASDTKDNKPSLQQYNYNRKCDEKKGMMENKHGRLNVDDDFCAGSHTSDSQVAQVLSSLRQTIDTIFISTIQRISDLMVKSTSSETHSDNDTLHCEDLLRKIENTKEERDSLYLQNMNFKKEIFDLKRRLADFHEEKVEQISTTFDAVRSSISAASFVHQSGHYVRIDEIDGVVSHLKKFVSEYGGDVTGVQGTISTYIHELRSDGEDGESIQDLWIRQIVAELEVLCSDQLNFLAG